MSENRVDERRAGAERRAQEMDRRQFVEISWPRENERRTSAEDRRKLDDRRS